jgi:hypothetical protein
MISRLNRADRATGVAALAGLLAAYLPWYSYTAATSHISVNGFRASALGDLFFLGIAATAILLLIRLGMVLNPLQHVAGERVMFAVAAGVSGAAVALQLLLAAAGGKSISFGLLLGVLAAAGLGVAAWMRSPAIEPRRTVREMLAEDVPD